MCLDFPELKENYRFKNSISIYYNNDNVFEEIKQKELDSKRIASYQAKKGILKDDGTPYFSTEYLIRTELKLTDTEIKSNQRWLESDEEETSSSQETAYTDAGGSGVAASAPAGGEQEGGTAETIEGGEVGQEGSL
jgi:hypothetical protein